MKCSTSNLQVENIITRINNGDINLQPDFQRGEVWSPSKQKKLIDSILRNWTIPPIHIVPTFDGIDEVLDGQQRLVAIRDFVNGALRIDGNIPPKNDFIESLNGFKYEELTTDLRRKFNKYEVSFVTLSDFEPSEPAELFDRLNQPTKLTSAEQRNAYMGETRNQIELLVKDFELSGANKEAIGFSNSRLAYDEIISKFCYVIDSNTLRKKIVSNDIASKYRSDNRFSNYAIDICQKVLKKFMKIVMNKNIDYQFSFNKATIFSWLIFLEKHSEFDDDDLTETMLSFEIIRDFLKGKKLQNYTQNYISWYENSKSKCSYLELLVNIFNQKASMGSTDSLSIIYRDIILHIFHLKVLGKSDTILIDFEEKYHASSLILALEYIYEDYNWGEHFNEKC